MPCVATRREHRISSSRLDIILTFSRRTLKNPRVSDEAKSHANEVLNNELGWNNPRHELYDVRQRNKDPTQVGAGLKA